MKKQSVKIKIFALILCICFCIGAFAGCANYTPKVSDEIWDNSNAVYVSVASEHAKAVFKDWENAFSDIGVKAVFITYKDFDGNTPSLALLLVLENGGTESQAVAVELLNSDERVKSASAVDNVPFEPINTLAFPETQISANIGDVITLTISGESREYFQDFSFNNIFPIVLKNYKKNKTYTAADFPLSGASKIEAMNLSYADYLLLHLETPSYFNAIKAVHAVAQNPEVLTVGLDYVMYPAVIYSDSWIVSDISLAEIINLEPNGWDGDGIHTGNYDGGWDNEQRMSAEILCKQAGTFTVTFTQSLGHRMGGSAMCTITVS